MKKIMPSYYSSGNLIVRTDSYDEKQNEKSSENDGQKIQRSRKRPKDA